MIAAAKKPVRKPHVAEDVEPVHIASKCATVPQRVYLGGNKHKRKIQFNCAEGKTFLLLLDGGLFYGHDRPFLLKVSGPRFVPDVPLEIVEGIEGTITNFVHDINGANCARQSLIMQDNANPPDIVIGN
jgi:hypothetical protein